MVRCYTTALVGCARGKSKKNKQEDDQRQHGGKPQGRGRAGDATGGRARDAAGSEVGRCARYAHDARESAPTRPACPNDAANVRPRGRKGGRGDGRCGASPARPPTSGRDRYQRAPNEHPRGRAANVRQRGRKTDKKRHTATTGRTTPKNPSRAGASAPHGGGGGKRIP